MPGFGKSPLLRDDYALVVNFILKKDCSVEENLAFARELLELSRRSPGCRLLQVSSVSAYDSSARRVTPATPIAPRGMRRGGYSTLKSEVDHMLLAEAGEVPLTLLRPGLVLAPEEPPPAAGIARRLGPLWLVLGGARSALPLVEREDLHEAIVRIAATPSPPPVVLAFSNAPTTKVGYVRAHLGRPAVTLPAPLVLLAARILRLLGVFDDARLEQVRGLFRETRYDATESERALGMSFRP
jgi:nucleoside-diphosphate-sugar epimerase